MTTTIQKRWGVLLTVLTAGLLSGCGMMSNSPGGTDASAVTGARNVDLPQSGVLQAGAENSSQCGNEPSYTVKGRSYQVLTSSKGYQQEGLAVRYGAEYQGTRTAGCETFNMQSFTAAHRTLPLPSFVRVTNLTNDKKIIVKVNDRGPFEDDGLIQLSAAAASALGIAVNGNARVSVEAVGADSASDKAAQQKSVAANKSSAAPKSAMKQPTAMQVAAIKEAKQRGKSFFVVINNYQNQSDALEMFVRLTSVGLNQTEMASAVSQGQKVHQVRVGPLYTQDQIDSVKDTLASNGLATFKVVEVDQ